MNWLAIWYGMQEDEDLDARDKSRTWDGELSDSDSEDHDLPRRHQGVIASEAAFTRSVCLHPCSPKTVWSWLWVVEYQLCNTIASLRGENSDVLCWRTLFFQASYFRIGFLLRLHLFSWSTFVVLHEENFYVTSLGIRKLMFWFFFVCRRIPLLVPVRENFEIETGEAMSSVSGVLVSVDHSGR